MGRVTGFFYRVFRVKFLAFLLFRRRHLTPATWRSAGVAFGNSAPKIASNFFRHCLRFPFQTLIKASFIRFF